MLEFLDDDDDDGGGHESTMSSKFSFLPNTLRHAYSI
jgi:hypothetical protein